jgi:hypothetical protein
MNYDRINIECSVTLLFVDVTEKRTIYLALRQKCKSKIIENCHPFIFSPIFVCPFCRS